MSLELAREIEADILEILLCHVEHVSRVGQEYIAALTVLGHILVLALLEYYCLSAEPHVASNVRYIVFAMRTNTLLTPCEQGAVLSRYSIFADYSA